VSNKHAIVTGASEGIGRAFAMDLAGRGWSVLAVARNEDLLAKLLVTLPGDGHGFLIADLATPEGVAAVEQRMQDLHVHLLVNNAGIGAVGGFTQVNRATHRHLVSLNISALTDLSHAFMKQAQAGDTLINVSSILAFVPQPVQPVYSATKAFVTSLSESLWIEGKPRGVHVFGLHPGATDTRFGSNAGRPASSKRPGWMLGSSETVVAVALRAMEKKHGPNIVPGLVNRLFLLGAGWLPRGWLLRVMGRAT
jgi:uncharacterized protein